MATQLQFRRGTSAQNNAFTGAAGEITLDTDTNNIRIHDGATAGGAEIIPAGTIMAYGGASAPTGYLLCDASAVSRTTYARLFAAVGTAFGTGDGSTTFNVPDLRDKVPLGKGSNNATLGTTTGSAGASSVLTSASKTGVTTAASNTGTGNTGTGNTGTSTSGASGVSITGATDGSGVTITGSTANSTATTAASNTGTGNTGTGNTGTGTTGGDGADDLTPVNVTVAASAKDSSVTSAIAEITQANHTHTIPALTVPALSIPALTIPSLTVNNHTHGVGTLAGSSHTHGVGNLAGSSHDHSIPALSIPALSIPALTVPSLSVNSFTVNTTLPSEVVNYIIKT